MAVANGALLEVPVFEKHHRGTNWLAVIDIDGTAPSGLSRQFIDRGKGECFYLIEQVKLFDPVEFGADYTRQAWAEGTASDGTASSPPRPRTTSWSRSVRRALSP